MLTGERAVVLLHKLGSRIKPSYKIDKTDKMRCFLLEKTFPKIQLFFDAKTISTCSFRFDCKIPNSISGVTKIEKIEQYSTAVNRVAVNEITDLYRCNIENEKTLEILIEYFESMKFR